MLLVMLVEDRDGRRRDDRPWVVDIGSAYGLVQLLETLYRRATMIPLTLIATRNFREQQCTLGTYLLL